MTRESAPTPLNSGNGAGPATGPPSMPCTQCTITSKTVATSPANRARTRIGVGEEVELTVNPGPATWAITSGTGRLSPRGSQTTVTYTASDTGGNVTITATGAGCSCTITLTVVVPSSWTMKRQPGTKLRHNKGRPDCGWHGIFFVQPKDVNFYNMEFREKDSQYEGDGSYSSYKGAWHGNYALPERVSAWLPITSHTDADGSQPAGVDSVDTGDPGPAVTGDKPPFKVGSGHFPITMQWKVGTGDAKDFPTTRQEDEIFADVRCESRKGGNTEHTMYSDPTSTF
jgi:hypothetical protein